MGRVTKGLSGSQARKHVWIFGKFSRGVEEANTMRWDCEMETEKLMQTIDRLELDRSY